MRGKNPVLPCWTAGCHQVTRILPLSQHLQGIQGRRPFLYSSLNLLDTLGHVGFYRSGEGTMMPAIRTLWSTLQCTSARWLQPIAGPRQPQAPPSRQSRPLDVRNLPGAVPPPPAPSSERRRTRTGRPLRPFLCLTRAPSSDAPPLLFSPQLDVELVHGPPRCVPRLQNPPQPRLQPRRRTGPR